MHHRSPILRALDLAFTALLLWAGLYILLYKHPARLALSVVAAVLFFAALLCLRAFRRARRALRERARLLACLRLDALLLMPRAELLACLCAEFPGETILLFQQEAPLTTDQLLPHLQGAGEAPLRICAPCAPDPACARFLARQGYVVAITEPTALFKHVPEPTDAALYRAACAEKPPRRRFRSEIKKIASIKDAPWTKYALLALLFFALSLAGRQVLYYRILCSIASLAASFALLRARRGQGIGDREQGAGAARRGKRS